jgi:Fe-Mn family superoxide dismutase
MTFTLPKLSYAYNALEPVIDARTMEIHYTKHHQAYIDKLNEAMQKHPELEGKSVEELLKMIDKIPEDIRTAVRNHGGGHANHSMFWKVLSPEKKELNGDLLKEIEKTFGSVDKFKELLLNSAVGRFGSGWVWLVLNGNKLEIYNTANQDSPLMEGKIPLLGIDVWEHAYYLHYQNKRADYVKAVLEIIDWDFVADNLKNKV